jgi:putative intracellular protease/amidase
LLREGGGDIYYREIDMPKILMPLGDATEALDTFYPFFRLQEAGFEVVVAGPEARLYHTVLHEIPPDSSTTTLTDLGGI